MKTITILADEIATARMTPVQADHYLTQYYAKSFEDYENAFMVFLREHTGMDVQKNANCEIHLYTPLDQSIGYTTIAFYESSGRINAFGQCSGAFMNHEFRDELETKWKQKFRETSKYKVIEEVEKLFAGRYGIEFHSPENVLQGVS